MADLIAIPPPTGCCRWNAESVDPNESRRSVVAAVRSRSSAGAAHGAAVMSNTIRYWNITAFADAAVGLTARSAGRLPAQQPHCPV
jgi:hypothetical protein